MEFTRIADQKRVNFIVGAIKKYVAGNGRILDVGCGNGVITRAVGEAGYDITGIDVSEKTINIAKAANSLPNVRFIVAGAEGFRMADQFYNAVICSEVLEHLSDPGQLLRSIYNCLGDDGILIVTVPNGKGPRELFVTRPVQYFQRSGGFIWKGLSALKKMLGYRGITEQSGADDLSHLQFFTATDIATLASVSGFRVTTIAATNFIEQVFPFSLMYKRSRRLQKFDCVMAEKLPLSFTSGFMTVWKKS